MTEKSYLGKSFYIADPDARLRQEGNLMAFETSGGVIRKIPQGTAVRVVDVHRVQAGARKVSLFAKTVDAAGQALGWTSTANLEGRFINELLDLMTPPAGSGRFGPNAAWSRGTYTGQIDLVEIVDARTEIERIATGTVQPFLAMVAEARSSGVTVAITAAFAHTPSRRFCGKVFKRVFQGSTKLHGLVRRTTRMGSPSTSLKQVSTATRPMNG